MQNINYSKIAKFSFFVLLFFAIFGTAVPFRERVRDIEHISTSNIINQILYSVLFIVSSILLIPKKNELFSLIKKEKYLFLFIAFSFLSIIWSDYSLITFKRIFQLLTTSLAVTCFLLYVDSAKDIIKYFQYIVYPYLIITIIVVFVVPGAKDPQFHTWRGLTDHKNTLGQVSLILTVLCYIFYRFESSIKGRSVAIFMLIIAMVIVWGAYSSTSILALLILMGTPLVLSLDKIFKPIGIGRTVSVIIIAFLFFLIITLLLWLPEMEKIIPVLFGKDTTFSGRTDLWEYLIDDIGNNIFFGFGYQAYWVPDNPRVLLLYKAFVWLPNQAHNGYLDIMIQTGIVGLSLTILLIFNYIVNYIRINKPHPWVWFLFILLITNFQESTILRTGQVLNFIFIFSYLLLFVNYFKPFVWDSKFDKNT